MRIDYLAIVIGAVCVALGLWLAACGAAASQGAPALYGLALQGCIRQAQVNETGTEGYEQCAHNVDVMAGLADGGSNGAR